MTDEELPERLIGERECHQITGLSRAHRWRKERVSLELRALTALLELHLSCEQPSDLPAKLSRVMSEMGCAPDRPDVRAARELLVRAGSLNRVF